MNLSNAIQTVKEIRAHNPDQQEAIRVVCHAADLLNDLVYFQDQIKKLKRQIKEASK